MLIPSGHCPTIKATEALNWCGLVLENVIDLSVLIMVSMNPGGWK